MGANGSRQFRFFRPDCHIFHQANRVNSDVSGPSLTEDFGAEGGVASVPNAGLVAEERHGLRCSGLVNVVLLANYGGFSVVSFASRPICSFRMDGGTARKVGREIGGRTLRQDFQVAFQDQRFFSGYVWGIVCPFSHLAANPRGVFPEAPRRFSGLIFRLVQRYAQGICLIRSQGGLRVVFCYRVRVKGDLYLGALDYIGGRRDAFADYGQAKCFV